MKLKLSHQVSVFDEMKSAVHLPCMGMGRLGICPGVHEGLGDVQERHIKF